MSTSARQATTTKINGIVILHHSLQLLVQKVPDPSCVKQSLNLANRLDEKSQITRLEWHGPRHAKQITSDTTDFPKKGKHPGKLPFSKTPNRASAGKHLHNLNATRGVRQSVSAFGDPSCSSLIQPFRCIRSGRCSAKFAAYWAVTAPFFATLGPKIPDRFDLGDGR